MGRGTDEMSLFANAQKLCECGHAWTVVRKGRLPGWMFHEACCCSYMRFKRKTRVSARVDKGLHLMSFSVHLMRKSPHHVSVDDIYRTRLVESKVAGPQPRCRQYLIRREQEVENQQHEPKSLMGWKEKTCDPIFILESKKEFTLTFQPHWKMAIDYRWRW